MAPALMTAEELLELNVQDKQVELVRGQLVVREPPGFLHGVVAMRIGAGVRLVWVVDPVRRSAHVYCADGTDAILSDADTLQGEDVLPDFTLELAAIL